MRGRDMDRRLAPSRLPTPLLLAARLLAPLLLAALLLTPAALAGGGPTGPEAAEPEQPADPADPLIEALVEEAVHEAFVLPELEDGEIAGLNPKGKALLDEVQRAWRRLGDRPGVEDPMVTVVSGGGDVHRTAVGTGELKEEGRTPGRYLLALGERFDEAESALMVTTWNEAGELLQERRFLEWDGEQWSVREVRGWPPAE